MMKNDLTKQTEWVTQFRLGLCRNATRYRRLLRESGSELSQLDREGVADLLTTFEDFLMDVEFETDALEHDG